MSLFIIFTQEFFTEHHWEKLPVSWQKSLQQTGLHEACYQLLHEPYLSTINSSCSSTNGADTNISHIIHQEGACLFKNSLLVNITTPLLDMAQYGECDSVRRHHYWL